MQKRTSFLLLFLVIFLPQKVSASGVVQRREAMKRQAQERAIAQQSAYQQQAQQQNSQLVTNQDSIETEMMALSRIWHEFETSSEMWVDIMDSSAKELTVRKYVEWYRDQDAIIKKSPVHYVQIIDDMANNNPDLLLKPFKDVIMFVAIMEYDFYNGHNQDDLARQVLPANMYEQNKQRLGK